MSARWECRHVASARSFMEEDINPSRQLGQMHGLSVMIDMWELQILFSWTTTDRKLSMDPVDECLKWNAIVN